MNTCRKFATVLTLLAALLTLYWWYTVTDYRKFHCVHDDDVAAWCVVRLGGFADRIIGCDIDTPRGTCDFLNCPSHRNGNQTCRFVPDANYCQTLVLGVHSAGCINWRLVVGLTGCFAIVMATGAVVYLLGRQGERVFPSQNK